MILHFLITGKLLPSFNLVPPPLSFFFFDKWIIKTLLSDASGTPALTSRGFGEEDFVKVAEYFDAAVKLALEIKAESKGTLRIVLSSLRSKHLLSAGFMCLLRSPWLI